MSYADAINEGLRQAMQLSPDVMVLGQLVDYKPGIFGTTAGLAEQFGEERVRDFPNAECVMTSVAIGSALTGMRPVIVHPRFDFMLYSVDPIVNWLSLWRFKCNNESNLPVTIRVIVGKGWGQGPQHSKSLHSWFAHLPGVRVAFPATASDVKGLLLESVFGESPSIIVENRSLFSMKGEVSPKPYRIRYGQAVCRREGRDVTVVALGPAVLFALRAAEILAEESVDVEVIDLRTVSPWDKTTVVESVKKTERLVVADCGWSSFGAASEIVASVMESCATRMKSNPERVAFPDSHVPMSSVLEEQYYFDERSIVEAVRRSVKRQSVGT
jgi:pyruvate dehydrogenase E1 component beta subunit